MPSKRLHSCGTLRSSCAYPAWFQNVCLNAPCNRRYTLLRLLVLQCLTVSVFAHLLCYPGSIFNFAQGDPKGNRAAKAAKVAADWSTQSTDLKNNTDNPSRSESSLVSGEHNTGEAKTICRHCSLPVPTVPDNQQLLAANIAVNRHHKCYEEVDEDDNPKEMKEQLGDRRGGREATRKHNIVSMTSCPGDYNRDNVCSEPRCSDHTFSFTEEVERDRCATPHATDKSQIATTLDHPDFVDSEMGGEAGFDASADKRTSEFKMPGDQMMDTACSVWGGAYEQRRNAFLHRYSQLYNLEVEATQARELQRFRGNIYLDYAGSGVYQETQLRQVYKDLRHNAYSNIHSRSPSSKMSEKRLSEARHMVKSFFDAPEDEYTVIFTSGATGALKLVGESFNFIRGVSSFYYLRINHNSVLGIREYAYTKGAKSVKAVAEDDVERLLRQREKEEMRKNHAGLPSQFDGQEENRPRCLFAFPAKDNWNGKFFPLSWIQRVQKFGLTGDGCKWYVLLDAAAHAPTTPLSLSKYPADFVILSMYKLFGYPTGIGALIARNEDACALQRIYWGGGSVAASVCDTRWQKRKAEFSLRFEDGTVSFLAIVGTIYGFRVLQAVGMEQIHKHVSALTNHLYERLLLLKHSNGARGVVLYWSDPDPPSGGVVTFNILRPDGSFVPFTQVDAAAAKAGIHLRTGCFCNPGGCQDFLGLTADDIIQGSENRQTCSDPVPTQPNQGLLSTEHTGTSGAPRYHRLPRRPLGSVRVSLGYLSTFADVDRFVLFVKHLWVN